MTGRGAYRGGASQRGRGGVSSRALGRPTRTLTPADAISSGSSESSESTEPSYPAKPSVRSPPPVNSGRQTSAVRIRVASAPPLGQPPAARARPLLPNARAAPSLSGASPDHRVSRTSHWIESSTRANAATKPAPMVIGDSDSDSDSTVLEAGPRYERHRAPRGHQSEPNSTSSKDGHNSKAISSTNSSLSKSRSSMAHKSSSRPTSKAKTSHKSKSSRHKSKPKGSHKHRTRHKKKRHESKRKKHRWEWACCYIM